MLKGPKLYEELINKLIKKSFWNFKPAGQGKVMVKVHHPTALMANSMTIRYDPTELKSILHAYPD